MGFIIIFDLICFVASTDDDIMEQHEKFFRYEEITVSTLFLFEYIGRIVTVTEKTKYQKYGSIRGRIVYACTLGAIVDALATFPVFIEILTPLDNLPTLAYLRVFRLFRIWKTSGSVQAMDAVYPVYPAYPAVEDRRRIRIVSRHSCTRTRWRRGTARSPGLIILRNRD